MKRYLKTQEEVTQALREGKTVQTNEMEYGIINNLIVGFDKIVREISINPAIRLSENPYINEPEPLKLEVGKFYKTRDGRKAFVYTKTEGEYPYWVVIVNSRAGGTFPCTADGRYFPSKQSEKDIVAPWEE